MPIKKHFMKKNLCQWAFAAMVLVSLSSCGLGQYGACFSRCGGNVAKTFGAPADPNRGALWGDAIHGRTEKYTIGGFAKLHKPNVEQAGFAVLKAPDIPSVLIETAFISNPDEELRLRSPAYQAKLADAIMQGIRQYFAKFPPTARSRSI